MRRIKHEQQNCLFNFVCGAHSLLVVGAAEGVGVGMNREDIIRMARKAAEGMEGFTPKVKDPSGAVLEFYERFAALVASAERERLTDAAMKAAEKAVDVAIALEREACAKLCEQYENDMGYGQPQKCADAIRARGQA